MPSSSPADQAPPPTPTPLTWANRLKTWFLQRPQTPPSPPPSDRLTPPAGTTVVFVHGFISGPGCWDPFLSRLTADDDLKNFGFTRFHYPTEFIEWNPSKRIPDIKECANSLAEFLDTDCPNGPLILVGHSMGGLVIQSFLAQKIAGERGMDLARIRSVVLFATPNRGSTILTSLRSIFTRLRTNSQEQDLQVLNKDIAETSDVIVRSILDAQGTTNIKCPIPFRVFWGAQDAVVPEVSARGSFVEASCLPGGHSEIIRPDPADPRDQRYLALKDSLLNPVGHPSIYDIDLFEVTISVSPTSRETTHILQDTKPPMEVHADNVALRLVRIVFSRQNRCRIPYDQTYRSENGFVESLGYTGQNQALPETMSEYYSTGKRWTYLFTPDQGETFQMKLRIYDGFGDDQRSWHNHMKANAHYKLFRFTLNLKDYRDAGYSLSPEPSFYYHSKNIEDHTLCSNRVFESPLPYVPSADPWMRTWEMANIHGGVVDIAWDLKKSVPSSTTPERSDR